MLNEFVLKKYYFYNRNIDKMLLRIYNLNNRNTDLLYISNISLLYIHNRYGA